MNKLQWKQWYREQRLLKKEEWRPVVGYEGLYEVSNLGRVRSMNYKRLGIVKIIGLNINVQGYPIAQITSNGKKKNCRVHRLVAEAFIPNPENKPQVNHKNAIKIYNFSENLEWTTSIENRRHAWGIGLYEKVRKNMIKMNKTFIRVNGRLTKN